MTEAVPPAGEFFSRVYLRPAQRLPDSEKARTRLGAYIQTQVAPNVIAGRRAALSNYIKMEAGYVVPWDGSYSFEDLLTSGPVDRVLDVITTVWRWLGSVGETGQAKAWLEFARRVLREENVGYMLDDRAGAHYFIDEAFEQNRVAALQSLGGPRYAGVQKAFESAHGFLDPSQQDTKAAVRSMFEALEILAKLMVPGAPRLNKALVEGRLKALAVSTYAGDPVASATTEKVFDGFALWVDALHNYRHGQGTTEPVAPPVDATVFVLSSGAAYLRWLITIDLATIRS